MTDLLFIRDGRLILNTTMEKLPEIYTEVHSRSDQAQQARALGPISERPMLGGIVFIYENRAREDLEPLGKLRTPSVADLFVAKMQRSGEAA